MKKFRYKRILLLASLQFCGNIVEYFSQNSEKLVVFFVMPRVQNNPNLIRVYQRGRLGQEKKLISSSNFFLYYFLVYFHYLRIIFGYFSPQEKFYFIHGHPLFFFFNSLLKKLRKFEMVYWIGDYYPPHGLWLRFYRWLVFFYHQRTKYTIYLSDRINKKMNGKVIDKENKKTVMWGVMPSVGYQKRAPDDFIVLCFIGLVKESQGLPRLFRVLKENKKVKLKVLGFCPEDLYQKYTKMIREMKIIDQVYFPNKFIENLEEETKDCQIGVALYRDDPVTYYTDPGKVKTYTQLGLPVMMSDISVITNYIKEFKAGEVVGREMKSINKAIEKIKNDYQEYIRGVERFNNYFYYNIYYKKAFQFLEEK